jgi:hypothetical protein
MEETEGRNEGGKSPGSMPLKAMACSIAFGLYLFFCAYQAWSEKRWPVFVTPKLDLLSSILIMFGHPDDAVVGACFLIIFGGAFIIAPLVIRFGTKKRNNRPAASTVPPRKPHS